MAAQPRFSILFVLGRSHTGTTLLGRMLNMHDQVLCAGEMLRLDSALSNPGELCSCGMLLRDCPFWNRWINKLPNALKTNYANWTFEILDEIRSREGKGLLVDLSKTRAFRLSHRWRTPAVGYLLMVRDPRGTLRSDLVRGKSLFTELRLHRKWLRRYLEFANRNARNCFTVFYEDLISSAECQLRRICQFLGLDYSPQMLAPDAKVHHFVRSSLSGFLKGANRLQVDERWRSDLTPEQIKTIDRKLSSFAIYREHYQLARTAPSPVPVHPTATGQMITRVGKLTWRVRPDFEAFRPVLEDPERFLQDPVIQYKHSPNITVAKINFDGPNCPGLILRRLNYGKFLHRLRDFFRRSRAERAMAWGLLLGQVGIATPRPLAAANVRCCRWPLAAYLITEEVPGAKTLTRFVKEKPAYSENVLLRLADLIAALHNAGYSHRDLKATNVLLDDQLKPWLIDLDGIRRLDRFGSRAAADLERLARNFNPAFLRRAGPPFLRRYCQRRHDHPSRLQLFRKLSAALRRST